MSSAASALSPLAFPCTPFVRCVNKGKDLMSSSFPEECRPQVQPRCCTAAEQGTQVTPLAG